MHEKICLYSTPFFDVTSYLQLVDIAAKYQIQNIETINGWELAKPDLDFARKLRSYADEKGIQFTCASVGINMVGDNWEDVIQEVKGHADVAAILGAPYLHHTIALSITNPENTIKNFQLFYERGLTAVRKVYDYAASLGIRTIFEDQGFLFNGVENFGKFLQEVDRNVGVLADFGNIMFVDEVVEDFIPPFADRIVNVHVKDYIQTMHPTRQPNANEYETLHGNYLEDCALGDGNVNFEAAFDQLRKIGYSGYYALECPPQREDAEAAFLKNIAYLESFLP